MDASEVTEEKGGKGGRRKENDGLREKVRERSSKSAYASKKVPPQ